jgi:competence protein ComEA
VNVNTASADELERLPGVGPVLARRIVQDRQARGPFRRVEDLERVRGIGPGLVRRLRPLVRLD